MNVQRHASVAAGSLAHAIGAFPRGPRISFAPEGGYGADPQAAARAAAVELKRVCDEVKAFGESAQGELRTQGMALDAVGRRMDSMEQKMARRGGGGGGGAAAGLPSLGEAVINSDEFKSLAATSSQRGTFRLGATRDALEFKNITTASGSGGALLPPDFRPDPVILPQRRLAIRDLVAPGETSSNTVSYPRMVSRTNNAAFGPEGQLKPQSDLGFALVNAPVQTLAHFFVGSRQMLDDAPALRSLIDNEARYGLRLVEDAAMLYGDGTGVNLLGIIPQAAAFAPPFNGGASDTAVDNIIQAIAQVEALDYEVDGMVLNAVDWRIMQAIKDGVGRYLSAGPFGAENSRRLWDVPVVGTNQMPRGQFLVGGFRTGAQIFDRMSIEVLLSTEHADFFTRNLLAIRAEERLAFTVQRPNAFVTGKFTYLGASAPTSK